MKTLLCKACLFIIFIICSYKTIAQDNVDSLKKVLLMEKEDTNKINTLDYLYHYYYWTISDYENAMQSAKAVLALSTKINYKPGIADGYFKLGSTYGAKKDKFNESEYFNKSLALYVEAGNKQNIIGCYDDMANTYMLESNFGKAIEYRYDAQKVREQTRDKKIIADGFLNIAIALGYSPDNSEEVIKNSLSALKLYKELNNKRYIGRCFYMIGGAYSYQKKYTEALDKFTEALQILKDLETPEEILLIYQWIESVYENQGDSAYDKKNKTEASYKYQKAEENELNALSISRNEYPLNMSAALSGLGQIDIKLGKLTQAKKYLDSSLIIYKRYAVYLIISHNYYNLSKIDSIQGNYKEAYKNYRLFHMYSDSVKTEENTKATVQAQMKYNYDKKQAVAKAAQDKKDADAKRIKNQQLFTILALGIIVLSVMIIALIQFRNNKHKQKANVLLEKQKQKVETTLTELKSTQAQLIQSEKMASLGELTAGIAHEIQNPLNFVNNFSEVNKEMLEELRAERLKPKAERDDSLEVDIINDVIANEEKINHHGKRADAIVKGMLQHSRQASGVKEPTDINALCDEYLRLSNHGLRAKDKNFNAVLMEMGIKTDFDESIGNINIVPQDIGRVLLNLFNNAFYATSEKQKAKSLTQNAGYKPLVSVQTKKINNSIEIQVKDNGNGIPQHIIDKIFQPFFTTKPTGEGTGLGLSLAYDIITKEHNGTIKVESKEGEGTMFIIQLLIN